MKNFKKLLALGLSVGVLASSMICASAAQPDLDELIHSASRRSNCSVRTNVGAESLNAQMDQIREARTIYSELNDLKSSGAEVSDEVLNNYADRLINLK